MKTVKMKWTSSEIRIIPAVGMVEKGSEFEVDEQRAKSFEKQGLAKVAETKKEKKRGEEE